MNYAPRRFLLAVILLFTSCAGIAAQDNAAKDNATKPSPENTAKAEAIVSRGIEVLGGNAYVNVQTVVGRGFFTPFQDGISQVPTRFLDYIAYPNKERTEFTADGIRTIQSNSGETGWVFDGATKTLNDMKAPQIEDFKRGMRTSVENLTRGWWKKENATLSYVGRREAGLARRNETVRLTYPDGFWIEYEFAAKEGSPEKIIYKTTGKKFDSEESEERTEEDRLAKLISVSGVTAPWVVDHFINGVQTSRISYEGIEYNRPLPDTVFAKPANIKALK
jgi:hypothetical protein